MAKWQPIREARGVPEGTTADLLMDDGKVVRATWCAIAGTFGNCPGSRVEKIPSGLVAWWLDRGKWRGQEKLGLYQPLSFRVVGVA